MLVPRRTVTLRHDGLPRRLVVRGVKRIRRKVSGKTNQEVRDKLKALHQELHAGVKSSRTYTVREAVEDWPRWGWTARLSGRPPFTRACWDEVAAGGHPRASHWSGEGLTDCGGADTVAPWRCRSGAWRRYGAPGQERFP